MRNFVCKLIVGCVILVVTGCATNIASDRTFQDASKFVGAFPESAFEDVANVKIIARASRKLPKTRSFGGNLVFAPPGAKAVAEQDTLIRTDSEGLEFSIKNNAEVTGEELTNILKGISSVLKVIDLPGMKALDVERTRIKTENSPLNRIIDIVKPTPPE